MVHNCQLASPTCVKWTDLEGENSYNMKLAQSPCRPACWCSWEPSSPRHWLLAQLYRTCMFWWFVHKPYFCLSQLCCENKMAKKSQWSAKLVMMYLQLVQCDSDWATSASVGKPTSLPWIFAVVLLGKWLRSRNQHGCIHGDRGHHRRPYFTSR